MVPEAGVAVALLTNGGDVLSLYHDVVGHVLAELAGAHLPGAPEPPPTSPERIDASRYVGTYSAEVADLIVSQDEDGRIWIDQTPKGLFEELGEKPERKRARPLPRRQPDPRRARPAACTCRTRSSVTTATATPSTSTSAAPSGAPEPDPLAANRKCHEADHSASQPLRRRPLRDRRPPCRLRRERRRLRHGRVEVPASTPTAAPSPWRSRATRASSTRSPPPAASCSPSTSSATTTWSRSTRRSGEIQSQLAAEWKVDGTTVTLTLAEGITCSDGSDFTATTVADNIAYVGDPKNKSPYLGTFLPVGRDREGRRRRRHGDDHAGRSPRRSCSTAWPACRWSATPACRTASRWHDRPPAPARTCSPRPCPATTTPTRSATATPGARTARRRPSRACPTPSS